MAPLIATGLNFFSKLGPGADGGTAGGIEGGAGGVPSPLQFNCIPISNWDPFNYIGRNWPWRFNSIGIFCRAFTLSQRCGSVRAFSESLIDTYPQSPGYHRHGRDPPNSMPKRVQSRSLVPYRPSISRSISPRRVIKVYIQPLGIGSQQKPRASFLEWTMSVRMGAQH